MRKLPALLLACMLCLLFVCPSAGAARSGSGTLVSGDYEYTLQDNGTAVITRFTGNADVVVIPARLDGIPVSALGEKSFAWCPSLLDVTIPEGITSIGDYAFLYCTGLAAVFMPDSLTDIGRNPFTACSALADIIVSDDHPALLFEDGVLFSRQDYRLVTFTAARPDGPYSVPDGTRTIGASAFYSCRNLTALTLPESVSAIG